MLPERSVRKTLAPLASRRSIVDGAGCPKRFPYPEEITAISGATASRNGGEVLRRAPW
jgi:hypothetical protein